MTNGIVDKRAPKVNSQLLAYLFLVVLAVLGTYVAVHNSDKLGAQQVQLAHQQDQIARQQHKIKAQQHAIKAGLIRACSQNGNPLRSVVRSGVHQDIAKARKQLQQTQHADFGKFFPNVPPQRLRLLKQRQIKSLRSEIAQKRVDLGKAHSVACASFYR